MAENNTAMAVSNSNGNPADFFPGKCSLNIRKSVGFQNLKFPWCLHSRKQSCVTFRGVLTPFIKIKFEVDGWFVMSKVRL